jgi:hypothetical protein
MLREKLCRCRPSRCGTGLHFGSCRRCDDPRHCNVGATSLSCGRTHVLMLLPASRRWVASERQCSVTYCTTQANSAILGRWIHRPQHLVQARSLLAGVERKSWLPILSGFTDSRRTDMVNDLSDTIARLRSHETAFSCSTKTSVLSPLDTLCPMKS